MGALFDFKCTCDSTLVYVCQADAEKCIFVWTILSQTPRRTPQVTSDAGRDFQPGFFDCSPKNGECWENEIIKVGSLFTFLIGEWQILPLTDRKKSKQMSWKNLQMLEFCHFTWSRMGPINCAPNPIREKVKKTKIFVKQSFFNEFQMKFRTQIRNQNRNNLKSFLEENLKFRFLKF